MELSEAFEIVEETVAMFQEFCVSKALSMKIDGEDFMLTPVIRSYENCFDDRAGHVVRMEVIYYTYETNDGEKRKYLEDIRPVCKCLINEWPSQKTRRIRDLLIDTRNQCYFDYGADLLDDEDLNLATTGKEEYRVAFLYNRRQRLTYNIRTFVMDTLFEICRAIRATEHDEPKDDKETPVTKKGKKTRRIKEFREFVKVAEQTEEVMGKLHRLIGNKTNTDALKIIVEAMWLDMLDKPTSTSIYKEFSTITCSETIISKRLNEPKPSVQKELDKIKKKFAEA